MKIQNYVQDNTVSIYDKLVGTDANDSSKTKNFEIGSVFGLLGNITQGPAGPQGNPGVQGIPGTAGAVGPAGLEWKGVWTSGTSYIADDAVGYGGSSWFCILATSGTTTPNLDTTHWALLASQGAQGIQGIAGPTGPQGPQGIQGDVSVPNSTIGSVAYVSPNTPLIYDINTVYNNNGTFSLPSLTDNYKGKQIIVQCTATSVLIKPSLLGATISSTNINGFSGQFQIKENQRVRFVYLGNDYWFTEFLNPIAPAQPSYKYYEALITQVGTADPTVYLLENTLGYNINWVRTSIGLYTGTTSGNVFTNLKTSCLISPSVINSREINPINDTTIQIKTFGSDWVDGFLNETTVVIKVYN
jgi:hypothetical protein